MRAKAYRGAKTREISFPLGGIGTGCIGLAGNGRLIDWEIFNRPNKGNFNGFTHFAVKAEKDGRLLDARVLQGDLQPPYTGERDNFGFGPRRENLAGMPHFEDFTFKAEFPFAEISFRDPHFPGKAALKAFNPFIPQNAFDSSLPAAFFEVEFHNTSSETIDYIAALSVKNPFPAGTTVNKPGEADGCRYISLESDKYKKTDAEYGNLCAMCGDGEIAIQPYWYRSGWFDSLGVFWRDFTAAGPLKNRVYASTDKRAQDTATISSRLTLEPGEKKSVRFILSWSFPNCTNYWNPEKNCACEGCCSGKQRIWKNYYATVFDNSLKSALYCMKNYAGLRRRSSEFARALYSTTIPDAALEAVAANLSIMKSPTCLRLEDGSLYGFEGCSCATGCCEGSCTHVWHYEYAFPFLFPDLERSMQDLDFRYNQGEDGGMSFRLQLPLGRERWKFRPCADGQFGNVLRCYQHWKYTGDTDWLRSRWENIKKCIEYAWADSNGDRWDHNRDGVLEGRQHHTLDMELFGPSSWLNGFYLGALKAGAEMAEFLGESENAAEYRAVFEKGREWVEKNLFNGEYYFQKIDLSDKSVLANYNQSDPSAEAVETYWNAETGEIKYQIGEGCEIDQVLAQWHANLSGLGEIFEPEHVKKALSSIYRYNFKPSMRECYNPCRIYCLNGEGGLVICDWPEGAHKPSCPVPYSEETMNGFEYQASSHMIQEGYLAEGLACVKAIRERYDGEKRNPWNEFECGSNYARSMASYALIPSYSGFSYDMTHGRIGFAPKLPGPFKSIWTIGSKWGTFEADDGRFTLKVVSGKAEISELGLPLPAGSRVSVTYGKAAPAYTVAAGGIAFEKPLAIKKGGVLSVKIG